MILFFIIYIYMYMCISLLRMKGITNCFCSFFFYVFRRFSTFGTFSHVFGPFRAFLDVFERFRSVFGRFRMASGYLGLGYLLGWAEDIGAALAFEFGAASGSHFGIKFNANFGIDFGAKFGVEPISI